MFIATASSVGEQAQNDITIISWTQSLMNSLGSVNVAIRLPLVSEVQICVIPQMPSGNLSQICTGQKEKLNS